MLLKEKLFKCGIYGKRIKIFDENEIDELLNSSWAEIITDEQHSKLKEDFHVFALEKITNRDEINDKTFVRMNTQAWKMYLIGNKSIINLNHFKIIDLLLNNDGFASTADIRKTLSIDPKTMFYFCKKLKELDIIEEKKEKALTFIKLKSTKEKTEILESKELKIDSNNQLDNKNVALYSNLNIYETIQRLADTTPTGISSKIIEEKTGFKVKLAIKLIQKLCMDYPEKYILQNESLNTARLLKCYNKIFLEKEKSGEFKKLQQSATENSISFEKRAEAMRYLLKKHKCITLNQRFRQEMSDLLGSSHLHDRKTILRLADKMSLKVIKKTLGDQTFQYVISEQEDERDICSLSERDDKANAKANANANAIPILFLKNLKSKIVYDYKQLAIDNGRAKNIWVGIQNFYNFIQENATENTFLLNEDAINKFPSKLIFGLNKIKKSNLQIKAACSAYKEDEKIKKFWKEFSIIDFNRKVEPIKPEIIDFIQKLLEKNFGEYVDLVSEDIKKSVRIYLQPLFYKPYLKMLSDVKFISYNPTENGIKIYFEKIKETDRINQFKSRINQEHTIPHANFIDRINFFNKIITFNVNEMFSKAQEIINEEYSGETAKALNKILNEFFQNESPVDEVGLYDLQENQRDLYKSIKKTMIFGEVLSYDKFNEVDEASVTNLLKYMRRKRIVEGFGRIMFLPNIKIHSAFEKFFEIQKNRENLFNYSDYSFFFYEKIKNIVKQNGTIDFKLLIQKIEFLEEFELIEFFEKFKDDFTLKSFDTYTFISISNADDIL